MDEHQVADATRYLFASVLAQGPVDRYWVPRTRPEEDEANLVPGPPHPRSSPATWQQKISRVLEVKLKSLQHADVSDGGWTRLSVASGCRSPGAGGTPSCKDILNRDLVKSNAKLLSKRALYTLSREAA